MIQWDAVYSVGIEEIDNQHKKFIDTLNSLYTEIPNETEATLEKAFAELENYALYHFATEEKYFDEFKYEGAEEHKMAHAGFKQTIDGFRKRMSAERMQVTSELVDYLEDWLTDHLVEMDQKYISCFREHGLK
jgi:hemerythrin-like metal-binding protein